MVFPSGELHLPRSKDPLVSKDLLESLVDKVSLDPLDHKENAANAESVVPQAPQAPQVPREAPTSTWPGRCA